MKKKTVITLPDPFAIAALNTLLDVGKEKAIAASGITKKEAAALRAVFGMLVGVGLEKTVTIELEGAGPIKVRPVDARHVAMQSLAELARLEAAEAIRNKSKKKKTGKKK